MKKLLFGMVAVFCCLAFVAPAIAKVTMGGMITMDAYWTKDSKEQAAAKAVTSATAPAVFDGAATNYKSESYTYINMDRALTRFNMRYDSDDKLIIAFIETRYGLENSRNAANILDFYYAWIDYRPGGENLHFRFGAQPETFAVMAPGAAGGIGYDTNSTLLVNFGNLHSSSVTGAKLYARFAPMIRMELFVADNGSTAASDVYWVSANREFAGTASDPAIAERGTIPRFDLSFPIEIGKFVIEPSGTWIRKSYEYVSAVNDDNFDIWGTALCAKAGFGPFTISGEITYGQNLGNANYTGAGNKPPVSTLGGGVNGAPAAFGRRFAATARVDNNGNFTDTEYLGWWVQAEFDFGPFAIQAAYGQEKNKNDDLGTATAAQAGVASAGEILDTTRKGYALRFPIKVTKEFTIAPNVMYFDFDDSAMSYGRSYDLGTEWVAGVSFSLVF